MTSFTGKSTKMKKTIKISNFGHINETNVPIFASRSELTKYYRTMSAKNRSKLAMQLQLDQLVPIR